jgi:hypothetical protein
MAEENKTAGSFRAKAFHGAHYLQDQAVGLRCGSSPRAFGRLGWPGEPIHKTNQADK